MAVFNFTARAIEALRPTARREAYWDSSVSGFGLRVTPSGKKSWFFMYRIGGRLRRLTIGPYPILSLAEARGKALEAKHSATHDRDPALEKTMARGAPTFADLVEEYIERHAKPKKKSWYEDERILRREFLSLWKNYKAKDVSRRDVMTALDRMVERGSPVLANKALAVLRKAFNFAIQRDLLTVNPCWNVPAPGKIRSRDRVLGSEEIRSLWLALESESSVTASFYQLLLLTAQRSGEWASAEWSEIDLVEGWWVIPGSRAKNGMPHRVPLPSPVVKILRRLKLQSGGSAFVFPSPKKKGAFPIKERKRALSSVRRKAKVEFWPHDLRRTAASHMTSVGIPRLTVSKILNHAENSVTAVYDRHSYDAEKRVALDSWSARLLSIVEAGNGLDLLQERAGE